MKKESVLGTLYGTSLALLTDLYEITMAYAHWKEGTGNREAVFELTFRQTPFNGGFAIACGLDTVLEFLRDFHFSNDDAAYLGDLKGDDGKPLFEEGFLTFLHDFRLNCDVWGIPEGTVVFPHEPLVRVQGPILHCQLIEIALLNIINFQTLIATRAARVKQAARGEPVIEFGLRRAQGIDGSLAASRAAFIGGADATSNVLAGKLYGIPVRGTHAHSWVMAFDDEGDAFQAYARALPNNTTLLVDTYDTLEGVKKAAEIGLGLKKAGHALAGIRLDSGDLAWLSVEARKILDAVGLTETRILASNDLDEYTIESLKLQGAAITMWGVGTRLVTGGECSALGGVYKLSAVRGDAGQWEDRIKLSEQAAKTSVPGIHQVRRFVRSGQAVCDVIFDERLGIEETGMLVDPVDPTRSRRLPQGSDWQDLLVPIMAAGEVVYRSPGLPEVQARTRGQLEQFHDGIKRFLNPHRYPVGLEKKLNTRKLELIELHRGKMT